MQLPYDHMAPLRSKSKDWLAQNQDNVFERSNMSTHLVIVYQFKIRKKRLLKMFIINKIN
jgi:hypothetical protein